LQRENQDTHHLVIRFLLVRADVSGGPFGIEPSIRAAGNFYAILGNRTSS
jgi:hypothetical protein